MIQLNKNLVQVILETIYSDLHNPTDTWLFKYAQLVIVY